MTNPAVDDQQPASSLAEAVGLVVLAAAWVEYEVTAAIATVAGTPVIELVAKGQPWSVLTQMLRNVAAYDPDVAARVAAALAALEGPMADRNHVVHGTWLPGRGEGEHVSVRPTRSSGHVSPRTWTVPQLLSLAERLREASEPLAVMNGERDW